MNLFRRRSGTFPLSRSRLEDVKDPELPRNGRYIGSRLELIFLLLFLSAKISPHFSLCLLHVGTLKLVFFCLACLRAICCKMPSLVSLRYPSKHASLAVKYHTRFPKAINVNVYTVTFVYKYLPIWRKLLTEEQQPLKKNLALFRSRN